MLAGQKSNGNNGLQNALFPLSYLYMTQEEGGGFSHRGTYAIDFSGWGPNGKIYKCPYYAPFDCKIVSIWGSTSPMIVWQSINPVNYVNGMIDYMCIGFVHDDNTLDFKVGDVRLQGEVIGHTGTYGEVTGDHVHIECSKGLYAGYYRNEYDVWQLRNEFHIYDCLGINDTIVVNNIGGLAWRYFKDVLPPYITKKKRFPWVLYSRKFRIRSSLNNLT